MLKAESMVSIGPNRPRSADEIIGSLLPFFRYVVRERVEVAEKMEVAVIVIRAKTVSDIEIILFALNSYLFSAYGKNIILQNIFFRIR